MKEKVIFHIDVNSAYLSWEAAYRLYHLGQREDLRLQPAAVAGDAALRHGIILAKSIPAGRCGVKTGDSIFEARQKCPGLRLVPPNYRLYHKCSEAFMEILDRYAPRTEQYSIDEAYADMTEVTGRFESPRAAAEQLRREIRRTLGFTVNIGISSNKLLAKMASDFEKPDKVHTLYPEEIPEKLWPLPVKDLFFAGPATTRKLQSLGIRTIGELAHTDPAILHSVLKKHGEVVWAFANGIGPGEVESSPPPNKGYGNSITLAKDVCDLSSARLVVLSLAELLGERLRAAGVEAGSLSLEVKDYLFQSASHQKQLDTPTSLNEELYHNGCGLLEELWDGTALRHMGLRAGKLRKVSGLRQQTLFDTGDYEKLIRMNHTVDRIRRKYGRDALRRAAFLERRE